MSISKKTKTIRFLSVMLVCLFFMANFNLPVRAATSDIPVTRTYTWVFDSSGTKRSTTELYLYPGDIVYINFSYSPSTAAIRYGLYEPSGTFRYLNAASGKGVGTIVVNQEGIHKFEMKNDSSVSVTAKGSYSTGSSYPLRSPKLATYISTEHSSSHYGLDITTGVTAGIKGYPIYSICKGTVMIAEETDSTGWHVVIKGDNGFVSRYLHMLDEPIVEVGDTVTYTTILGEVGNSGKATGYHLHIDINNKGLLYGGGTGSGYINYSTTLDPQPFFPHISFT